MSQICLDEQPFVGYKALCVMMRIVDLAQSDCRSECSMWAWAAAAVCLSTTHWPDPVRPTDFIMLEGFQEMNSAFHEMCALLDNQLPVTPIDIACHVLKSFTLHPMNSEESVYLRHELNELCTTATQECSTMCMYNVACACCILMFPDTRRRLRSLRTIIHHTDADLHQVWTVLLILDPNFGNESDIPSGDVLYEMQATGCDLCLAREHISSVCQSLAFD